MRLGKGLIGNPLFGSKDGRRLGEVKDLYLDEELTSVVGIYLGREGLLRPAPRFVERGDIALFGIDALLVKDTFTVYEGEEAPEPPGWLRLEQLRGREVQTPGGTKIGRIGDVALDEEARVTGFSLTNLSVKGPVAEADAVARSALVEVEDEEGVMTIDLPKAEQSFLKIDPDLMFSEAAPVEAPEELGEVRQGLESVEVPQQPGGVEQDESDAGC